MKILHRAKEKNNWVYGLYAGADDFIVINENAPRTAKVSMSTLGVYINRDCITTGKPIFTNDIVKDYRGNISVVFYDNYTCSFRLRSSLIYAGSNAIDSSLELVGNLADDQFKEPKSGEREATSITPTSQSSQRRSHKEALKGIGL